MQTSTHFNNELRFERARQRARQISAAALVGISACLGASLGLGERRASATSQPIPLRRSQPALSSLRAPFTPPRPPPRSSPPKREVDVETDVESPPEPAPKRGATPLGDDAAALHLAEAYVWLLGQNPSELGLSILWAHWAHETARGQRMQAFNFAGLKGTGPGGASVVSLTREDIKSDRLVPRTFRAYADEAGGARDYLSLLGARYPAALRAVRAGDTARFVAALDRGGYFSDDPAVYSRALISLAAECRKRGIATHAIEAARAGARTH